MASAESLSPLPRAMEQPEQRQHGSDHQGWCGHVHWRAITWLPHEGSLVCW
jgi:hypothetical protein